MLCAAVRAVAKLQVEGENGPTAALYDTSEMDEMGGSRELGESASGRGELTRVLLLSQSGESTEAPKALLSRLFFTEEPLTSTQT